MNLGLRPVLFLAVAIFSSSAWAEARNTITETATVERAIDGDTLVLTDGQRLRLDAVNALEMMRKPDDLAKCLPSLRTGARSDYGCDLTLARAAQRELQQLTAGKTVKLLINPSRREDRYGRLLAQVLVTGADGQEIAVTERLLADGLVHVYPLSGREIGTAELLKIEARARAQKLGIWQLPDLQPTPPERAQTRYGHYALIEGTVVSARRTKTAIQLNFGPEYRTDFTVQVDKRDWSKFKAVDLLGLQGKRVLVRGYLYEDYGPAMRLTNDGQLTVSE